MIAEDLAFVRRVLAAGILQGPVLELGTGYGGATSREAVVATGLEYVGTDLKPASGVDFVADFEDLAALAPLRARGTFGAILMLNVLEHTFEPVRILDNARTLLRPGGSFVTIAPAAWPLHDYPFDAWRLLPNFYEQYARRRGMVLREDYFEYVGRGPVRGFRAPHGDYAFPQPIRGQWRYAFGRGVHKVFNTFGRGFAYPSYIGVGAVLTAPGT